MKRRGLSLAFSKNAADGFAGSHICGAAPPSAASDGGMRSLNNRSMFTDSKLSSCVTCGRLCDPTEATGRRKPCSSFNKYQLAFRWRPFPIFPNTSARSWLPFLQPRSEICHSCFCLFSRPFCTNDCDNVSRVVREVACPAVPIHAEFYGKRRPVIAGVTVPYFKRNEGNGSTSGLYSVTQYWYAAAPYGARSYA
jgi:hypothetical protein